MEETHTGCELGRGRDDYGHVNDHSGADQPREQHEDGGHHTPARRAASRRHSPVVCAQPVKSVGSFSTPFSQPPDATDR